MTPRLNASPRPMMVLCIAAGGFEFVVGFVYPAIALNLEQRGVPVEVIGYQAAMIGLGLALSPLAMPWLAGWFGMLRVCVANFMMAIVALLTFALSTSIVTWLVLSLVFGIATSIWYAQSETWVNELALESSRGKAIGLFSSLREGGMGLGPLLLPILGYGGFLAYGGMAVILLLVGGALLAILHSIPRSHPPGIGEILTVSRTIPLLMMAIAVGGFFDGSVLPFWIIYGLDQGLSHDTAIFSLSLIKLGNIALQLPLGWIADRHSPRIVFLACIVGTAIGAACLPLLDLTSWLAWPYLLVWGALGFGVFTMSLIQLGRRLTGSSLVLGTAACGVTWGLGALAGSVVTGWLMAALGPLGLPVSILAASVLLLGLIVVNPSHVGPDRRAPL